MSTLFSLAALATVSVALVSCSEQTDTRASGSKQFKREIKYNKETILNFTSFEKHLIINGKTFAPVTGSPPYYLEIPGRNAIIFVTEPDPVSRATWHVYDFQSDSDTIVAGHDHLFGRAIGVGDPKNRSWIDSSSSNELVVANRFNNTSAKYAIDLNQRKVTKVEVFVYGQDGSVTNHYVRSPE